MATLDRWRSFLETPKTLAFPNLQLLARDGEPPIVTGSGELRMPSLRQFEYTLTGNPSDVRYLVERLQHQRNNPFDALARFRLQGVDEQGIEWSLGWTVPHVDPKDEAWEFVGYTNGIHPYDVKSFDAQGCTEVIYAIPLAHYVGVKLMSFVVSEGRGSRRERVLNVLGSTIRFEYDPLAGALSVTATHSEKLPATYCENWLGEPFRILLGQLIYPRLVARNLSDGRSIVSIRPSPRLTSGIDWDHIWQGQDLRQDRERFWRHYSELLSLIAEGTDEKGNLNFEVNTITQLYEEVIQAAQGTRWVWAMTCSSCIEALVNILGPPGRVHTDADERSASELVEHVKKWPGDSSLKEAAINAVKARLKTTTATELRHLVSNKIISRTQLEIWREIRNQIMHGRLISPYSTGQEEHGKLTELAGMMRALTWEVLRRSSDCGSLG